MSSATSIVTVGQYLVLESCSDEKHEYAYGEVIAMAGASFPHNVISANLIAELNIALGDGPFRVLSGDQRVRSLTGNYCYPDATIVCAEPILTDEQPPSLVNPLVVIEILSPSTEARDRGAKFSDYQSIPSLHEYVLISQDRQLVEQFVRQEGTADWLLHSCHDPESLIKLTCADAGFAMSRLYRKLDVPLHPRLAIDGLAS